MCVCVCVYGTNVLHRKVAIVWLLTRRKVCQLAYMLTAMSIIYYAILWEVRSRYANATEPRQGTNSGSEPSLAWFGASMDRACGQAVV